MTVAKTLPDHDRCITHRSYRLSCEQYEQLLARCGQACEICRLPSARSTWGKLAIDHHGWRWAVRGLLCGGCNTQLQEDNHFRPEVEQYLANAWWQQRCSLLGLPAELGPEPPEAEAIQDQFGIVWIHLRNQWEAPRQGGRHPSPHTWRDLFHSFGAHNLVPYDLQGAHQDGSLDWGVRYCIENGLAWTAIRQHLGLPEPKPKKQYQAPRARDTLPWLETPEQTAEAIRAFLEPDECLRIAELLQADPGEATTGEQVA